MRLPYRMVGSFKGALFILAVGAIAAVVVYTNYIVADLRESSRRYLTLQVERFRRLFTEGGDLSLDTYLAEMQAKDFPLIVADGNGDPISWSGLPELENLEYRQAQSAAREYQHTWLDQGNTPVPIEFPEFGLVFYFYYGDSPQIRRLRFLPWIEIVVVGALILIGYLGFVNIKKSEERSVWVGMARETAHQLGTPLTSLMGWIELLAERPQDPEVRAEMQKDLQRLRIIAERFNQIGSRPALVRSPVRPLIEESAAYIQRRLPQLSAGEVKLRVEVPDGLQAQVNPILLGWVFENLIKNGIEALGGQGGEVIIQAYSRKRKVALNFIDTGHGIQRRERRNIFRPGFTTKPRGWGLGLSLARRIIEDLHHGRIYVAESKPRRGTVMRVVLKG
ncbi:MAG: HAMP domain-containing sensor histidine kinase [Calditrichota bacterium]